MSFADRLPERLESERLLIRVARPGDGAMFSEDYVDEDDDLGRPDVEVLNDSDILVLPQTARSVDDAIASGGSVTIQRWWSA